MPGTTLSGQLCAWISNFTVTNLAMKKSLTTEPPRTLFCQNLPCGSIYGAWSFGKRSAPIFNVKIFGKKRKLSWLQTNLHMNMDSTLIVLLDFLFICCVVSQTLWFVLCVYCCTPFFCYLWCVPNCRLFFLFPHPLNHARNLVATARSVRGGGAHFQLGTEV